MQWPLQLLFWLNGSIFIFMFENFIALGSETFYPVLVKMCGLHNIFCNKLIGKKILKPSVSVKKKI